MNNQFHDTLDYIINRTDNITLLWENAATASAPKNVVIKMNAAMFGWMRDLTRTLRLWSDKGSSMTDGELILARSNLGAIVESWLKLFYCAYIDDYKKNPVSKNRKVIEPNNLSFEDLKSYSEGKLYKAGDGWKDWIDSVQKKRNAIHSFNKRDIGNAGDYYDDLEKLYSFIEKLRMQLPPIEEAFDDGPNPKGYEGFYMENNRVNISRK